MFLFFGQDIAHNYGGYSSAISMSWLLALLAGFQGTIIGRIWATAEAQNPRHATERVPDDE